MKINHHQKEIYRLLNYQFKNNRLLEEALTHSSARKSSKTNNERLEFLGDRVLGLILAKHLFLEFDKDDQGKLTKRFHSQAQQSKLYEIALKLELQYYIVAEKAKGWRRSPR